MDVTLSERFLTVDEAARALGQSRSTIRRKVACGELRAVRLGQFGPLRVEVAAIEEHLRPAGRSRVAAPDEAATTRKTSIRAGARAA